MKREEAASGYTELEYIESSGTQYIDTGFKLNNNSRVIIEYMITQYPTNFSSGITTFGARYAYNNTQFMVYSPINRATSMAITYGSYAQFKEVYNILNNKITIDMNKNVANWSVGSDSYSKTFTSYTFQTQGNCYIFKTNYYNEYPNTNGLDPNQTDGKMRFYSMKIYDNGVLVRDYIPVCRNYDFKPGLYDIVNQVFYTNAGSGEFQYAIL